MSNYTLGIKEIDDVIGKIKKGSNLMLIGPPMSGKEEILNHIRNEAIKNNNAIISVTTRDSAPQILESFEENQLDSSKLGIVDCVSRTLGINLQETENIKVASNPVDLTGIGVKISQFFEKFIRKDKIESVQLHVNSLSTILMYSNIQTVFRFLHVFTGRIKVAGAIGIFLVESGMHEPTAIATLKQLFSGLIEVNIENDKTYMRVLGLTPKPTPWFEYEIQDNDTIKIIGTK